MDYYRWLATGLINFSFHKSKFHGGPTQEATIFFPIFGGFSINSPGKLNYILAYTWGIPKNLEDPTTFFDALGGSDNIFRCTWGIRQHFSMHLGWSNIFFDALGGSDNIFRCSWGIRQHFSMHLGWSDNIFRCTWGDPTFFFDALRVIQHFFSMHLGWSDNIFRCT